jgi:hypothetical protein
MQIESILHPNDRTRSRPIKEYLLRRHDTKPLRLTFAQIPPLKKGYQGAKVKEKAVERVALDGIDES